MSELGYEFIPTGMKVQRVFLKSGDTFGETRPAELVFQFPVLLKFTFGASLTSERGSASIRFYQAALRTAEGEILELELTATDSVKKEYDGTFTMEQIEFGPAPEGSAMQDSYNTVLAKE